MSTRDKRQVQMAGLPRFLNWPPLLLASASPRRRELLAGLGADFIVRPSGFVEDEPSGDPARAARGMARQKAAAAGRGRPGRIILAADTVVAFRHHVLGKPADAGDAQRMLQLLSGRWHQVHTGVCLMNPLSRRAVSGCETTRVKFRRLSPDEIRRYVATGEPMDKAGAYGIQGRGALLVEKIDGCYFNVMGLPLARLNRMVGMMEETA
jgi:septum formation protein